MSESPSNWEKGCLGDIAKVVSGYAFPSIDFHDNHQDGIPVVRMSDIQDQGLNLGKAKRVSNFNQEILRKFQIRQGDLLFGMSGSIEKSVLVNGNQQAFLNQRVGALRPIQDNGNFHAHIFQSEKVKSQILDLASGGAQLNISAKQVESIQIEIPPLPEQKKIAEILSGIDNLAKAKEKSLFKCKKLLLAKILGEYSDISRSNLHRISLAELAQEVKRGPSLATNSEKKGIRYITSGNIADGKICLERDNKFLDGFQGIDTCTIKANDLVLNCVNSSAKIGESAIFNCSEHCITGFNNFAITLFPHLCNPRYVYYWTTSTDFKSQVRTIIKDAINQVSFSKKDLREFAIYLPDLVEQDLVASELDSIQRVCDKKNQELIALKNLKSGISSLLLSGRKRVSI